MFRISTGVSQPLLQVALQAFDGRLLVADEQALHVRVAQDDSAPAVRQIGLGPAQAPRIGRLARALDDLGTGSLHHFGHARVCPEPENRP